MRAYKDLSEDLKEIAREMQPEDYETWSYQVQGVEIAFCAR